MPPVVTIGGFIFLYPTHFEKHPIVRAKKEGLCRTWRHSPSCLYEVWVLLLILCVGEEVARGEAYEVVDTTYQLRLIALEVEDVDGIGRVG